MPSSNEAKDALSSAINGWFQNFAGTSALDIARDLSLDHARAMQLCEELAAAGYGSINSNVMLYQVTFDPENIGAGFKHEPVVTHIFFPSKQSLHDAFYCSDLPKQRLPEYTTRLHLGAHQIGLAYFAEEVLARYFDHPEIYEINDSLAGGDISALSAASEDRYLYVRYGKCRLQSGGVAVTAIFNDLSDMGSSEQRYWHSFELESPDIDKSDTHFQNFLARTYEDPESGRPLSSLQLLALLEDNLKAPGLITGRLRPLSQLRVDADHKILTPEAESKSYSRQFAQMCNDIAESLEQVAPLLAQGYQ